MARSITLVAVALATLTVVLRVLIAAVPARARATSRVVEEAWTCFDSPTPLPEAPARFVPSSPPVFRGPASDWTVEEVRRMLACRAYHLPPRAAGGLARDWRLPPEQMGRVEAILCDHRTVIEAIDARLSGRARTVVVARACAEMEQRLRRVLRDEQFAKYRGSVWSRHVH